MKFERLIKANDNKHKFKAIFDLDGKKKAVPFGAAGYLDYTIHKDDERKKNYIARHASREDWSNPMKPGTLSRFILWNKKSIQLSIKDYRTRFKI